MLNTWVSIHIDSYSDRIGQQTIVLNPLNVVSEYQRAMYTFSTDIAAVVVAAVLAFFNANFFQIVLQIQAKLWKATIQIGCTIQLLGFFFSLFKFVLLQSLLHFSSFLDSYDQCCIEMLKAYDVICQFEWRKMHNDLGRRFFTPKNA